MFARPGLPRFDYVQVRTLDEAVGLLTEHGPAARLLMGGTDLLPGLREGLIQPRVLVDVKQIRGMRHIAHDEQGGLTVGAAVTMNQVANNPAVQAGYPLLAEAASTVASYQIRNRATLGGNLCNASPCADTSPATLALEAEFVLHGPDGERSVSAREFFVGPGQTVLRPGELMTAICFPPAPDGAGSRYLKLGRCKSGDLALVGVAILAFANGTGSGYQFRIVLGSVAPTPLQATEAEDLLAVNPPGDEAFAQAAEKAMTAAMPITDVRGTASYQRAMVRNLTLRGLREVWVQLQEGN